MADGSVTIKVDLDGEKAQSGVSKLKTLLGGLGSTGSKVGSVFKSVLGANLISSALTKGFSVLTSNMGSAIQRFDTLNKYPTVMKSLGYSVDDVAKSTKVLSDGIDGLPTTLDGITAISQQLAPLTGSATRASQSAIALNNAFLASGAGADGASRGLQQYTQMLSTGKVDMMSWRTLQETMPIALRKTAEAFGYTGKAATNDLYEALKSGSITMDQLNDKFIDLNKGQNGFAELAKKNSAGIGTSFSNLRNAVAKNLANILTDINTAFSKKGLGSIAGQIDNLKHIVNSAFKSISPHVTKFAMTAIDVFGRIIDKLKTFWKSFTNTGALTAFISAIKSIVNALGHVWNALTASSALNVLASVLGNVVKWLSQATTVAANFIRSLPAGAIQAIVGGLVGLVAGFKAFNFLKSFNPFRLFKKNAEGAVNGATSTIKRSKSTITKLFNGLSNVIKSLGTGISTAAKGIGHGLKAVLQGFAPAIRAFGAALRTAGVANILAFGGAIAIAAVGIGAGVAIIAASFALLATQSQGISTILHAVGDVVASLGTAIGNILNLALQGLAKALVIVAPVLPTIVSAFAQLSPLITAAGTAISMVINAFSSLAPVITALGSALSQIITAISSGIAQIATAMTPIVEIISSAFVQVVTVVSQAIVQIIQALAPFIPAISEMVQAVAPVLQSLVEAFNNLISQISPIIDSLTQLLQTFGEQVSSILDSASGVVESFGSSIRNVLDGVAGIFESMGSAAKNAGQGVKLMAQGIKMLTDLPLGDLTGTLAAVAGGLTGIANSGIASAGPGLQQAGTGLGLIATSAQIASLAMQALPAAFSSLSSSIGTLPGLMTTAGAAMVTFASAVMTSFVGLAGSTASISALQSRITALSASMMMAQAGASAMSASFSNISRAATSAMNQLNSAVRSAMGQAVSTMRSSMQQIVSVVRQSASQMTQAGRQAGKGVSDGVTNGIRGGIGSARAAMSAMVNAIRSTGMSGAGAMRSVGAMIGQGLAQGMYSALGAVTAAANALVAQAERAAQAKAKIHSPSRLFRDNVGRYIAQGIAVGIEKNTSDVTDSLAYVQKEMSAFKFGAEDLLGLGNSSLSSQFKLKSITERAEMSQIQIIRDQADKALTKALEVADQAVKRPVNMVLNDGTLVASTGDKFMAYQNEQVRRENRFGGLLYDKRTDF